MGSVADIKRQMGDASSSELSALIARYQEDERAGVQAAVMSARKRLERYEREQERLSRLYGFEADLIMQHGGGVAVGLDEVGRGPLAGPLAVGAVVLDPHTPLIEGLDDSKKLAPAKREQVSAQVKAACLASTVVFVSPQRIDEDGIVPSLKSAFTAAVEEIEGSGIHVDVILLDGNPLGFDSREVNVIKGDGRCASIAAASVIAKMERDELMDKLDAEHPGYGFASNKGYGSAEHLDALRALGLSTVHRKSYCTRLI